MLWNQTFGCAQALEYPEDLRKILQRLRSMTDIQLPTFPEADDDEVFLVKVLYESTWAYKV